MKKSIKLLSNVMIISFMLFSALPTFAEETSLTDIESTGITSDDPSSKSEFADSKTTLIDGEEADVESLPGSTTDDGTSGSAIVENTSGSAISVSTSSNAIVESTSSSAIECESDLLDVHMTSSVSIKLDPYELSGRGQIYSDEYKCVNLGNTDVLLTFTELKVIFANDTDFKALAKPFDVNIGSDLKEIHLVMNFGREDIPSVVLTDPSRKGKISIRMSSTKADTADNSFSISFSGNLNESPVIKWCSGDIKIMIKYSLEAIPAVDDSTLLGTTPAGVVFVTTPAGTAFVTTPAGAEFEIDQTESEAQGKDLSDEDSDNVLSLGSTPAGAVFEIDQTETRSLGTDHSNENSAETAGMDEIEITPAGTVQGSDQDESAPIQLELPEPSTNDLLLNSSDIETGVSASVYCSRIL